MSTLATPLPTVRQLCEVLFVDRDNRYHCRLCTSSRAKPTNGGYTNVVDHLHRAHRDVFMDEFALLVRQPRTMLDYVRVTVDARAMNAYQWMDWMVMDHHELAFCEKKRARRYSNLEPISQATMKELMEAVEDAVRDRIRQRLARKPVGLFIDAWTESGTHFAAVIAVTPSLSVSDKFLVCFSPFEDESDMSTDALIDLLDHVLDEYRLDLGQLCFYVCDHASVNTALANRTQVPMIGCASHRLQLAVQLVVAPIDAVITKISNLMVKLNGIKNRHRLREAGSLMPVLRNATRWGSTFAMIERYWHIEPFVDRTDPKLVDSILTAREEVTLRDVFESLQDFESVSLRLQASGQGQHELSLLEVRRLFDRIIQIFPTTGKYLGATAANVVKAPHFEVGIVKVLSGRERLTAAETAALSRLVHTDGDDDEKEEDLYFAEQVLRDGERSPTSGYIDIRWIPATSNEVERLFSRAGRVWSPERRAMHPTTLETFLFLEYNRSLWDAQLVAGVIRRADRVVRQRTG